MMGLWGAGHGARGKDSVRGQWGHFVHGGGEVGGLGVHELGWWLLELGRGLLGCGLGCGVHF